MSARITFAQAMDSLHEMFPSIDRTVIEQVLRMNRASAAALAPPAPPAPPPASPAAWARRPHGAHDGTVAVDGVRGGRVRRAGRVHAARECA
jgi:hypothetical protein